MVSSRDCFRFGFRILGGTGDEVLNRYRGRFLASRVEGGREIARELVERGVEDFGAKLRLFSFSCMLGNLMIWFQSWNGSFVCSNCWTADTFRRNGDRCQSRRSFVEGDYQLMFYLLRASR